MDPNLKSQQATRVLVTGGAGYIGSHAVWFFLQNGFNVLVLDTMENGNPQFLAPSLAPGLLGRELGEGELVVLQGNTGDAACVRAALSAHPVTAVFNFAAYVEVGESVKHPLKYYQNNLANGVALLSVLVEQGVKYFVQSSTAAVYGEPTAEGPIPESAPTKPVNAYGSSKLMFEQVLADTARAHGLQYVCFRYFNVCGAHPSGLIGELRKHESHLVPLVIKAALGRMPHLTLFGQDYPTRDGTCLRDYVDMDDLLRGHLAGLKYLLAGGASVAINLGSNKGYTVKEVIKEVEAVTGKSVPVVLGPRREGDPACLVAANGLAQSLLGWTPTQTLAQSIAKVWKFNQSLSQ